MDNSNYLVHNIYLSALQERWKSAGASFTGKFSLDKEVEGHWQDISSEFNAWRAWRDQNPLSMLACDHWAGNLVRQARLLALLLTPICQLIISDTERSLIRDHLAQAALNLRSWNEQANKLNQDPLSHPFTLSEQEEILHVLSNMEVLYFNLLSSPDRVP